MANDRQIRVMANERIDQVATRAFGDPFKHTQLIADNPELNIFYPHPDRQLTVSDD